MPQKKQHSLFELHSVQRHQTGIPGGRAAETAQSQERLPENTHFLGEVAASQQTESVSCPVCDTAIAALGMQLRIQHVETCLTLQLLREETKTADRSVKEERRSPSPHHSTQNIHDTIRLKQNIHDTIRLKDEEKLDVIEEGIASRKASRREEIIILDEETGNDDLRGQTTVSKSKVQQAKAEKEPTPPKKRKKKDLAPIQKENLRYVNAKPSSKRPRVTKTEEPPSDLLPSSRKLDIPELKIMRFGVAAGKEYCVSVDAFSFKPSSFIHQYFLSHFHSDHYSGISKRWCRERTLDSKIIYCSEITARLLQIRYNIESHFLFSMQTNTRYRVHSYQDFTEACISDEQTAGLYVTCIDANHCPGAVIFLFESISLTGSKTHYLHCGDFRVCESIMKHPLLKRFLLDGDLTLDKVYLDTTYMSPQYNFPKQQQVCASIADMIEKLLKDEQFSRQCFGKSMQSRITDLFSLGKPKKKLLVLVGTYLIGKERLATAISRRMGNAPIYVSNTGSRGDKEEIIRSYKDDYIDSVLSSDPTVAGEHSVTIHLVPMSTAGNIQDIAKYFNHNQYHQNFERCIGIRPTGWSFQNKDTEHTEGEEGNPGDKEENPEEQLEILQEARLLKKCPRYSYLDIAKQNTPKRYGKVDSSLYRSFAVPYSEHSSFRELSFFIIFFKIQKVIPTVNTTNEWSVQRMHEIIRRWEAMREMVLHRDMHPQLTLEDF